jgi:hypothetical protein
MELRNHELKEWAFGWKHPEALFLCPDVRGIPPPLKPQYLLFFGAKKRSKRSIPPTKAFPRGKDAIDYAGRPATSRFW